MQLARPVLALVVGGELRAVGEAVEGDQQAVALAAEDERDQQRRLGAGGQLAEREPHLRMTSARGSSWRERSTMPGTESSIGMRSSRPELGATPPPAA